MVKKFQLPLTDPVHMALKWLNCQVNLSQDRPPSSQWHRRPGRPHNIRVFQIRSDNNLPPADLWSVEVTAERRYGPCRLSDW